MFKTAKKITAKKYKVLYLHETKLPQTFVCPDCLKRVKQFTDNPILQRRAAKHVLIGHKTKKSKTSTLAMCSKCGFTKTN